MVAGLDGSGERGTALQVHHCKQILVSATGYEYKKGAPLSPFSSPIPVLTGRISIFLSFSYLRF